MGEPTAIERMLSATICNPATMTERLIRLATAVRRDAICCVCVVLVPRRSSAEPTFCRSCSS